MLNPAIGSVTQKRFITTASFISKVTLLVLLLSPLIAMADVGEGVVNRIISFLTGPIAIGAATIVAIFLGYRAWAGELTWRPALLFVVGAVFIFGAAEIAHMVIDSAH